MCKVLCLVLRKERLRQKSFLFGHSFNLCEEEGLSKNLKCVSHLKKFKVL